MNPGIDLPINLWQPGDIVTRTGNGDEHEIVEIIEARDFFYVKCIKTGNEKIYDVGEIEGNLTRRYSFLRSKQ